jgi:hypothetical protein
VDGRRFDSGAPFEHGKGAIGRGVNGRCGLKCWGPAGTRTRRCARPHVPILPRLWGVRGYGWVANRLAAGDLQTVAGLIAGLFGASGSKLALVLIAYFTGKGFERLAMALARPPERGECMLLRNPRSNGESAHGVGHTRSFGFTDDLVEFFAQSKEKVVVSHRF